MDIQETIMRIREEIQKTYLGFLLYNISTDKFYIR